MSGSRERDASFAVLTARARGAIAVFQVWGADALEVASSVFRPHRPPPLVDTAPGRLRVGRVGAGVGDEVVAVWRDGPLREVELQCHGGLAAEDLLVATLEAAGARRVPTDAWFKRAGRARLEADAEADLVRAATVRTAEILLDQADGALRRELEALERLVEEDCRRALAVADELLERAVVGMRLLAGWRVVLAGRPNVGKSSLLNALAGYDRAIVDSAPGTTRDVVSVSIALGGWPVELCDTAGLRATAEPIEAEGVARAQAQQRSADLVVLVLDGSEPLTSADRVLIDDLAGAVRVASKADLPAAWTASDAAALAVSAMTGEGNDRLIEYVTARLVPRPPPAGSGVPFRAGHVRALRRARQWIATGRVAAARVAIARLKR
jgi:tRNA modification GTPase